MLQNQPCGASGHGTTRTGGPAVVHDGEPCSAKLDDALFGGCSLRHEHVTATCSMHAKQRLRAGFAATAKIMATVQPVTGEHTRA